jgi:hypothetical protein
VLHEAAAGNLESIVAFSTQLWQARNTLYGIDPLATADFGNASLCESSLKGVSKPRQANPDNLALQVLTTQSGGLVLNMSNDVASLLQKCLSDTDAYYELFLMRPHTQSGTNATTTWKLNCRRGGPNGAHSAGLLHAARAAIGEFNKNRNSSTLYTSILLEAQALSVSARAEMVGIP